MSGFIDPTAQDSARLDRLEVLIDEALRQMDIVAAMSPEAQALYRDLTCDDPARIRRARVALQRSMDEDPL